METARNVVDWSLSLLHFPPELLGLILSFPSSSHLILRLWKCGNKALTARLALSVTEVHWQHSNILVGRFPSLLLELPNLRHLTVFAHNQLISSPLQMKSTLEQLPKGLQTLTFKFPQSTIFFGPPVSPLRELFPSLQTLGLHQSISWDKYAHSLSSLPENLTRLELPELRLPTAEYPHIMSILPRTLLYLDCYVTLNTPRVVAKESIDAHLKDWSLAPPQLKHIRSIVYEGDLDSRWLPRTLESCRFSSTSSKAMTALPDSLTDLFVRIPMTEGWSARLPPRLTALETRVTMINDDVPLVISDLPPGLTFLKAGDTLDLDHTHPRGPKKGSQSLLHEDKWPPKLETLNMTVTSLRPDYLARIPLSVTDLSLRVVRQCSRNHHLKVPGHVFGPNLKTLKLESFHQSIPMSFDIVGNLPSSMTSISIINHSDRSVGLSRKCIESLPDSITDLDISSDSQLHREFGSWKVPLKLPMSLTSLRTSILASGWFSSLPRSLKEIELDALNIPLMSQGALEMDVFEGLPSGLEVLKVTLFHHHPGTPKSSTVLTLPLSFSKARLPVLKVLAIYDSYVTFPYSMLQYLPLHMHRLWVDFDTSLELLTPAEVMLISENHLGLLTRMKVKQPELQKLYH